MSIFFSADHHFNHVNIIKYCNRPFENVSEMDSEMIKRWNSIVTSKDEVYYLGDLTLGNYGTARSYLNKLNGRIKFIEGNHDKNWFHAIDSQFKLPPIKEIKISKETIVLCHYPLASWPMSHYGSLHLHGHVHGTIGRSNNSSDTNFPPNQKAGLRIDVGVDCWNFYPVSLEIIMQEQILANS